MRIYLDAAPIIYLVEQVAPFAATVLARVAAPGVIMVSSDLARMEALIKPLRRKDVALAKNFDDFFAAQTQTVPVTQGVFRRAAEIRAQHNFRTPDAIHLSAALAGACDLFLTNDAGLKAFMDIAVEVVS